MDYPNACRMRRWLAGSISMWVVLTAPSAGQTLTTEELRRVAAEGSTEAPPAARSAAAQGGTAARRTYRWEIEVHGGGAVAPRSSRGDSNVRAGQALTSLEPALATGIDRNNGGILGARVAYALTSRISAELTIDYGFAPLEIDPDTLTHIEASQASFATAWSALAAGAAATGIDVTSTATIVNEEGRQLFTVGAAVVKLTPERRITPFLTGGIGIIANRGDDPTVTLTGRYSFAFDGAPFTETDRVTIRYALADRDVVGVVGGGITYAMTGRSGIRADVRAHIGRNSAITTVDASPSVQTRSPSATIASTTSPSLQLSSVPQTLPGAPRSTLSGAAINGFETFTGSGSARPVSFTAGWYWRF